jgi:S1-C subfamily serine protease
MVLAGPVTSQQLAPKPHYLGVEPDRVAVSASAIAGVRIGAVHPGSPAEKAGLRVGDIILKLGTVATRSPDDLVVALKSAAPGRPIDVVYLRPEQAQVVLEGRR